MKQLFILIILTGFSAQVYAWDGKKCGTYINKSGWWRTYSVANSGPRLGVIVQVMSMNTTYALDPGISTKSSTSSSQYSSSWGDCRLIGTNEELRKLRELYYTQNKDEVLKQMAQGTGEHLEVLSFFGRCDQAEQLKFNGALQMHFVDLLPTSANTMEFMDRFDDILVADLNCDLRS